MTDNHQWQQSGQDAHDIKMYQPGDSQEAALIAAWQQSGSFDDVVTEAQRAQGVMQ